MSFDDRIASTTIHTAVERQEPGVLASQCCTHPNLAIIHSKVYCTAFLLQQQFLVVSVGAVLRNGILVGLPSEVVLQFKRGERQAIDEQYKVNLIGIHLRVHHLTDYAEDVVPVSHLGTGVQF